MSKLEPYANFAALRELKSPTSDVKDSPSDVVGSTPQMDEKKWKALSERMAFVDAGVMSHIMNLRSLFKYEMKVCIPEVVLDQLDIKDKLQKAKADGSIERIRQSILELQEHYEDYQFQRVDEYDMDFIAKNKLKKEGPSPDLRLIVAAASYYQKNCDRYNIKGVIVISSDPEVKKLSKSCDIEHHDSIEAMIQ